MEIHIDRRRSDVEEELDNDVELEARREWDLAAESSLSGKRVPKPFPQFVPASSTYSELSRNGDDNDASNLRVAADTAQWYRSMVSQSTVNHPEAKIHPDTKTTHDSEFKQRQTTHVEIDKKSGFSEGAMSEAEMQTASTSSVSTLADMLARNPPPSSGRFQPPVWLAIGPSNKGYAMLEQSGWTEGEGLGRHAYRRKIPKHGRKGSSPLTPPIIYADKQEIHEIKLEDDISELRMVDIVDLTLHSSDEEDQQDTADAPPPPPLERDPYAPKSLLVPLVSALYQLSRPFADRCPLSSPPSSSQTGSASA